MVVQVITAVTGTGRGGVKKNLKAILKKHSTDSLERTDILGISKISFAPELWGLILVQQEYQEANSLDKIITVIISLAIMNMHENPKICCRNS